MWIVQLALRRPYTFVVMAIQTGGDTTIYMKDGKLPHDPEGSGK